jgi:DNA-binding PadR family transcriptional regulator
LILRTLSRSELRGYGIVRVIQQSREREFLGEEGSLYPALQRLELHGWIEGSWGVMPGHRRARVYRITTAGRKRLEALTFHRSGAHADGAPIADLRGIASCLLFGCVATGAAFGQRPVHELPSHAIPVAVCMEPTPQLAISTNQAKSMASEIFREIGVHLIWRAGLSDCEQSIGTAFQIRWAERPPQAIPAGALAASRPFDSSGNSITIYEVPLQRFLRQYGNAPEVVLAYVLAHELGHVMQGVDRHSTSGILKASWSYSEYYRMLSRGLTFTAEDVELIRAGLKIRERGMSASYGRASESARAH